MSRPQDPLDVLEQMVNEVLVETGRALKSSRTRGPLDVAQVQSTMRSKVPDSIEAFQLALDEIDMKIIDAKSVFLRDLDKLRAKRQPPPPAPPMGTPPVIPNATPAAAAVDISSPVETPKQGISAKPSPQLKSEPRHTPSTPASTSSKRKDSQSPLLVTKKEPTASLEPAPAPTPAAIPVPVPASAPAPAPVLVPPPPTTYPLMPGSEQAAPEPPMASIPNGTSNADPPAPLITEQSNVPPPAPMEEFDLSTFAPPSDSGALLDLGEFMAADGADQIAPPAAPMGVPIPAPMGTPMPAPMGAPMSAPMPAPMSAPMSTALPTSMPMQPDPPVTVTSTAPPMAVEAPADTIDLEMDLGEAADSSFDDLFNDNDLALDSFGDLDAGEFDSAMYGM